MRNKFFLLLGVLVAIGLIALKLFLNKEASDKEIKAEKALIPFAVEATTVRTVDASASDNYPGTIEPSRTVNVLTQTNGKVTNVNVAKGSGVQEGQIIATMRNDLKTQSHQINRINYDKAKLDYERIQSLYKENNATGVELEGAQHALKTAEKQLGISQTDVGYETVRAPITGIVTEKFVNVGDILSDGGQVATIVSLQHIELRVYVPESEISKVQVGQQVGFTVDAYTGYQFRGSITAIVPQATQAKAFPIVVRAANKQHGIMLMAGMTANVNFKNQETTSPLAIPRTAIRGDINSPYVWSIDKDKRAVRRPFQMGRQMEEYVEVISGLNPGEVVITKGQSNIAEGLKLESLKLSGGNTLSKH
ncbi:efflux RND transporter periplasmic adaptor subunit [Chitinophaga ginsengisoli]|uniref:HlyD family secretion protein n=1 Tax=Chitinophaga ginsengisoli TaxID=363837 RepID=A0A2P8G4U2_9BACT|nr:efflux RND transporter periplasmic adaptor subunit [Chitinophaga ginsengisoli]PSL29000.1 HlyD family secretion protein [Chitinophaga ginsengisoli]